VSINVFRRVPASAASYKNSVGGIVSYIACQLNYGNLSNSTVHPNNIGVTEVIIGPAVKEQQAWAVEALAVQSKMRFAISRSKIPYVAD
jgi:hypothetical protein